MRYHCYKDTSNQRLQIRKASSVSTGPSLTYRLSSPVPISTMMEGLRVCFQRASTNNPKMTKTQHLLHVASYYSQIVNTPRRREKTQNRHSYIIGTQKHILSGKETDGQASSMLPPSPVPHGRQPHTHRFSLRTSGSYEQGSLTLLNHNFHT